MSDSQSPISIALLDDHAIVLYGIESRLSRESDFTVVGRFENSRTMISSLRNTPVDILLVDYSLGPMEIDGASLIRALIRKFPDSKILVLSSHYDPAIVALAMKVGARGFVGKSQDVAQIVKAIRAVASGSLYLDDDMAYRLIDTSTTPNFESAPGNEKDGTQLLAITGLSVKEQDVIRCLLDGLSVTQIAEKFRRSVKTISTQKMSAFRKLGVSSDNKLFKLHMQEEQ